MLLVSSAFVTVPALADGPTKPGAPVSDATKQAREAYERGTRAVKSGDYALATAEFSRADELSPSPNALEAALDAAVQADDPVRGMELLERSKRAPASGSLAESIHAAHAKFDGRGCFVRVACADPPCKVALDGKEVDAQRPVWAPKGTHAVVREDGKGQKASFLVEVKPDATVDADAPPPPVTPPPPPPPEPPPHRKPLPPFVFWAGVGVTAALGATTLVFGLDANGTYDDFTSAGCARGGSPASRCSGLRSDGESAETRTNIALLSTVVVGLAVGVAGAFFTEWGGHSGKERGARTDAHSFGAITF